MKKSFLIGILCLFTGSLVAQVSPVNLGVHAGLVSTTMDLAGNVNYSNIKENSDNGMMLGAFLRINMNKWYLQPELNYVKRKGEVATSILGEDISIDVTLHSIDVPLLLGYKIVKMPMFKLRAYGGPVASFNTGDKLKITGLGQEVENIKNAELESAVWNAKFGAGVDVWKLSLDVDYEMGISDISKEAFLKKNKMLNVTLGFRFF